MRRGGDVGCKCVARGGGGGGGGGGGDRLALLRGHPGRECEAVRNVAEVDTRGAAGSSQRDFVGR